MDLKSAQRTQRNETNSASNETPSASNETPSASNVSNDKKSLRRPQEYFEWLGEPFTLNGTRYQSAVSNGIVMDLFAPKQS